jgi:uncharacterized phiE125 gp8 family phage protein
MGVTDAQRTASWTCRPNGWTTYTAPTQEPVTLEELREHARVTHRADDAVLMGLITTARLWVEDYTRRALLTQTLDVSYNEIPSDGAPLQLPRTPLQSVTSVTSYTAAHVAATLSSAAYYLDTVGVPARLVLNDGYSWPSDLRDVNAVVVRGVFGYATPSAVPEPLRRTVLLLAGHWYDAGRDVVMTTGAVPQTVPFSVYALLAPYRVEDGHA